jgi:hypothetical protein
MKLFVFIVALLSLQVKADFPSITAKNLSLDIRNNNGLGFVNFLKYDIDRMSFTHTALQAQVKKYPDRLLINDTETQIEFHYPLDFLDNFEAINIHEVNLLSHKKTFNLEIEKGKIEIGKELYLLDTLDFNCVGDETTPEQVKHAFDYCTNESTFSTKSINFDQSTKLSQFFTNIIPKEVWGGRSPIKIKGLQEFNFKITKNAMDGKVKVDTILNIPFHMKGNVVYEADKDRFKVELKEVKAFIFDIKKIVFREISTLGIKEITAEPPFIYISAKTSIKK